MSMLKLVLKLIWLGLGLFGVYTLVKPYMTSRQGLIQGIQSALLVSPEPLNLTNLKDLDPQQAGQVLGQLVKQEVTKVLESATIEIKQFPAQQVKKIKIGACEELLEEDICSVARQLQCQ